MFDIGFPRDWSSLKKLIWLKAAISGGGASAIWKTVTGALIHLADALASPVKELSVAIEPLQSGSGDPSPDNVRPITGWTGCNVWVKPEYDTSLPATASVTFPDTVYGGKYEFVSGGLTSKMASVNLGALNWSYRNGCFDAKVGSGKKVSYSTGNAKAVCNQYIQKAEVFSSLANGEMAFGSGYVNSSTCSVIIKDTRYNDATSFKSAMSGVQLVYELATPTEIQLTPQEITTLPGENNIWTDVNGEITLTYQAVPETAFSDNADTGMADYMTLTE